MAITAFADIREQLLDRRHKLERASATLAGSDDVTRLLREVDAALARVDTGVFGICETCRDPIEPERLVADPLSRFCIDHLSPSEQRALEHDLELASHIQSELLPSADRSLGGWEFDYLYQPARTVSGDYCDVIRGNADDVYFLVGDVAGHGIAAAILMSHLSALLRTLIPFGLPIGEMLERTNSAFCNSTMASHYATLVCVHAQSSGEIEICNAGHPPALWLGRHGLTRIEATALPVGMFSTSCFPASNVELEPGDTLLMYTDGLSDASSRTGELYGIDRIARVVASTNGGAAQVMQACARDVAAFSGLRGLEDDLTIFAMTRRRG